MASIYILPVIVIFWTLFLTLVFRLEKRMVWPYGELKSAPHFGDPSGYGDRWVAEAVEAGFSLLGWARDLKGDKYRISYAMLVSRERDIFAVIGVGSIVNIPLAATWLHTPTADGRSFYSTDKQSGVQIDLSHHWTNQLVPATNFRQLLQEHRDWIKAKRVLPRSFTSGREIAEFQAAREEHYCSMERAGLIGFTDGSARYFRFTLSGAARTATWGFLLGMARQLSQGRYPRNA